MLKMKLLLISVITLLFISIFHYLSLKNYWYWTFRWLDIPVHIVGGFGISLLILFMALKIKHLDSLYNYRKKVFCLIFFSILTISIFWEVFEVIFKVTSLYSEGYWLDSIGDIFNGVLGGLIAYLYFINAKNPKSSAFIKSTINHFTI